MAALKGRASVQRLRDRIRGSRPDPVLFTAFILAVISSFIVRPDAAYPGYIDWRSLGILWALMAIVQGLKENSVFERLALLLSRMVHSAGGLAAVLVFLCFFSSMLITNDVALITFVPFAVLVLHHSGLERLTARVVILQTLAANLGSMLTPVGNPQNLYLYGVTGMGLMEFMGHLLPYSILTAILLAVAILLLPGRGEGLSFGEDTMTVGGFGSARQVRIYAVLFLAALLAVFRVIPWQLMVLVVLVVIAGMDVKIILRPDYKLLATFICFFIFTGNMGRITYIHELLSRMVGGRELAAGILLSQVISNVPATLLLYGFSEDYAALLLGVNLGGLGTLIASMASLISYKVYVNAYPDRRAKYILRFTAANLLFLGCMIALRIGLNIFSGR